MSRSVVKSMCAVLKIEEERRCPWWRDENEGKIKLQKKVCPSLKPNSPRELFDFLSVVKEEAEGCSMVAGMIVWLG